MRNSLISRRVVGAFGLFATVGVLAVGCGGRSQGSDLLQEPADAGAPSAHNDDDTDDGPGGPPGVGSSAGRQGRPDSGSGGRPGVGGAVSMAGTPNGSGGRSNGSGAAGGAVSMAGTPNGSGGRSNGSGAAGGAGGVNITELTDECDDLCARTNQAQCENADTIDACTVACRVLVQQPSCAKDVQNFFVCADSHEVACDANGRSTIVGCEPAYLLALACIANELDAPKLEKPCASYCMSVSGAGCGTDVPNAECTRDCKALGAAVPPCTSLWEDYLTCSEGQTFICGDSGRAVAPGCIGKAALFFGCVLSAAGQ